MSRQELIVKIKQKLSEISTEIQFAVKANLLDFNCILEDILIPLLNELLDSNLQNTNRQKSNFPGIDLLDRNKKVGFQVTSDSSASKIKETINKIVSNNLDKEINELFFIIIRNDSKASNKNFDNQLENLPSNIKFNYHANYLDFADLFAKHIKSHSNVNKIWSILQKSYNGKFTKLEEWENIISNEKSENIYSNLAKLSFPEKLFIGHLLPEVISFKGKSSRHRVFNFMKDLGENFNGSWIIFENNIYTFHLNI